ncbi:hypothetical protein EGR_05323 [Echinococcus granulosus]|uniref:Uncharacterized protein n=1 Tax=Echinococcus granulosus TaxID=6210 RepID=W6UNJ4_ECHGR|nr:hypothetical protein EGR_05323 [Echinococcus granulosus]EUB59847.1 hypothetical protein EGR_05323 [Echinococcus granulosus]
MDFDLNRVQFRASIVIPEVVISPTGMEENFVMGMAPWSRSAVGKLTQFLKLDHRFKALPTTDLASTTGLAHAHLTGTRSQQLSNTSPP